VEVLGSRSMNLVEAEAVVAGCDRIGARFGSAAGVVSAEVVVEIVLGSDRGNFVASETQACELIRDWELSTVAEQKVDIAGEAETDCCAGQAVAGNWDARTGKLQALRVVFRTVGWVPVRSSCVVKVAVAGYPGVALEQPDKVVEAVGTGFDNFVAILAKKEGVVAAAGSVFGEAEKRLVGDFESSVQTLNKYDKIVEVVKALDFVAAPILMVSSEEVWEAFAELIQIGRSRDNRQERKLELEGVSVAAVAGAVQQVVKGFGSQVVGSLVRIGSSDMAEGRREHDENLGHPESATESSVSVQD
jgi:hypothetical protein